MAFKDDLWQVIAPEVEKAGFQLFDLETPTSGGGGILRIFISKKGGAKNGDGADKNAGVILDECASVSKRLEEITKLDEIIEGRYILEVSSPGINRKLTRPEHYSGAIGGRIKVVTEKVGEAQNVFRGKLLSFDDGIICIDDEESKTTATIRLADVRKARVDFKF